MSLGALLLVVIVCLAITGIFNILEVLDTGETVFSKNKGGAAAGYGLVLFS